MTQGRAPAAALGALATAVVVSQVWWFAHHGFYDFPAFYRAGGLVAGGHSPYLPAHAVDRDFLNGPLVGLVYAPLSLLSFATAQLTALVVSTVGILAAAVLLGRTRPAHQMQVAAAFVVVVLCAVPGRATLGLGQTTALALLAFAAWYAAYRLPDARHDVIAGVAGCVLFQVKPYLAVPLFVVALVDRRWRLLAVAAGSAAATVVAASLLASTNLASAWLDAVAGRQRQALDGNEQASLLSAVYHLTGRHPFALAVAVVLAVAATGLLVTRARGGASRDDVLVLAACWPVAASTFLHPQDLVVACWPLTLLLLDERSRARGQRATAVLAVVAFLDVWAIMGQPHSDAYVLLRQTAYAVPLWAAVALAGARARFAFVGLAVAVAGGAAVPVLARHTEAFPPWAGGAALALGGLLLAAAWVASSVSAAAPRPRPGGWPPGRLRPRPAVAAHSTTVAP